MTSPFSTAFSTGFAGLGPGSVIHYNGHGLTAGVVFTFANVLPLGSGIDEGTNYFVLATGLSENSFMFGVVDGGLPFMLTVAIDSGDVVSGKTYEVVGDGVMDPPTLPVKPGVPTVTSLLTVDFAGYTLVNLKVTPA